MRVSVFRSLGLFLLAGSLAASAQAPQPPIPTGPHVVLGRVVDIGTGAPIGAATVTLMGYVDAAGRTTATVPPGREREVPAVRHVMATADGYFVFHNLPAGQYALGTRAFGYVSSDYPPHIVAIVDGERLANVVLRLWKYAAIGGRVIDERGEPVTGMPVTALRRQSIGGALVLRRETAEVTTDDRGMYRISQLPPGEYVVGVLATAAALPAGLAGEIDAVASNSSALFALTSELRRSGFFEARSGVGQRVGDVVLQRSGPSLPLSPSGRPMGYANTLHPGVRNPTEATVITLGSGESRGNVDIPVRFAETVTVSGTVTGPAAMKQMAVYLVPPGISLNDIQPVGIATAMADAGGTFTFPAVIPGEYTLSALRFEGSEGSPDQSSLWAAQPVVVGNEDLAGVNVTLQPGVRLSGRVEFSGGPAVMSEGQRIFLSLQPFGAQSWRTQGAVVRSDGTFTTAGDPPGRYVVNVSRPPGWTLQGSSLGGTPLTSELTRSRLATANSSATSGSLIA